MRESIGSTFLYNIIFIFIILVFGLLAATLSYYKGYKVNYRILKAIQNESGYNSKSFDEIERVLNGLGYTHETNGIQNTCPEKRGSLSRVILPSKTTNYLYCVYYNPNDTNSREKDNSYYSYGVVTYIYIDLPIVGQFKVPVYTKGKRIYKFDLNSNKSCQLGTSGCTNN